MRSNPDGGLPDLQTRVVGEQTIAAGVDIAPVSTHSFTLRITLPYDPPPTAHHVTMDTSRVSNASCLDPATATADARGWTRAMARPMEGEDEAPDAVDDIH